MAASANTSRTEPDPAAPVVLVGLARSGSSLATLLLNRFAGGFVINDAYAAQIAEHLGAPGPSAPGGAGGARAAAALAAFRTAALARVAERSTAAEDGPIHRSARLTPAMARAAEAARGDDWAALWGAVLHGAARAGGRVLWGWNTPQDHLRAAEILAAFPRARFVFVRRGLWPALRSYKSLPEYWGRGRRRWHPALQARAWAAAGRSEARLRARAPAQVHRLDYEALLARPETELAALAAFLGVAPFAADPAALPANPSARGAELTRAEIWAARLALDVAAAAEAGPPPPPRGLGAGALFAATLRAAGFYGVEAAASRDMRGRIRRLMRA